MVSEMMNVTNDVKRPIVLIAFTALRGRRARISATAMGSQMMMLSTLFMSPHPALRATLSPLRGARDSHARVPLPLAGEGAAKRRVRVSREHPQEHND